MFELAPVDLHLPFTDSKAEFVANYRAQLPILVAWIHYTFYSLDNEVGEHSGRGKRTWSWSWSFFLHLASLGLLVFQRDLPSAITVTAGRLPVRYHVSPNSLLVGTVTSESRPSSLQVPVTDRLTPRRLTLSLPLCTSYCDTGTYYVLLLMTYDIMSINYWKRTFPTTSSRLFRTTSMYGYVVHGPR
jgi:hypothetical protein